MFVSLRAGEDPRMGMAEFSGKAAESGRGLLGLSEGNERAPSLPTGTVTLLLSDVEGSTRLWEADEETAATAIARHYELLDVAIAADGGVRPVEQGEGDSVVAGIPRWRPMPWLRRSMRSVPSPRSCGRPTEPWKFASLCIAAKLGSETRTTTSVRRSSGAPGCGLSVTVARRCFHRRCMTLWSMRCRMT